jgi:hypothetical protein
VGVTSRPRSKKPLQREHTKRAIQGTSTYAAYPSKTITFWKESASGTSSRITDGKGGKHIEWTSGVSVDCAVLSAPDAVVIRGEWQNLDRSRTMKRDLNRRPMQQMDLRGEEKTLQRP